MFHFNKCAHAHSSVRGSVFVFGICAMERRPTWLESSLDRSTRLGREVLARAQRRHIEWPRLRPSRQLRLKEDSPSGKEEAGEEEQRHTKLDDAFETIMEFMAHTTHQCKYFYRSVSAAESSQTEVNHVHRYHAQRNSASKARDSSRQEQRSSEDFHIEVAPGTYAITAGAQDTEKQTRLVQIGAGESVNLTFTL
nr:PREDICTED: A-kinase-interacting protein 1 isoform X2 [Lepisosteus oculatus]